MGSTIPQGSFSAPGKERKFMKSNKIKKGRGRDGKRREGGYLYNFLLLPALSPLFTLKVPPPPLSLTFFYILKADGRPKGVRTVQRVKSRLDTLVIDAREWRRLDTAESPEFWPRVYRGQPVALVAGLANALRAAASGRVTASHVCANSPSARQ